MKLTQRQIEQINNIAAAEAKLLNESTKARYSHLARAHAVELMSEAGVSAVSVDKRIIMEEIENALFDYIEQQTAELFSKVSMKASKIIANMMNKYAMTPGASVTPTDVMNLSIESDSLDEAHFDAASQTHSAVDAYIEKMVEEVLNAHDGHM